MCIAILNTPNVTFPKSLISTCWDNNGDGAGLIYTGGGSLYVYKELHSVDEFYNKYIDVRRRFPKSKIVLHFRISTSGGINVDNCHPFSVSKDLAFVHNGIISELNGINPKKSDTNLFNEFVLQQLPAGFTANPALMSVIEKYIGSSKLIFLDKDNEATIVNEELGVEDAKYLNCWFSNSTYKPSAYYDRGGVNVWKGAGYKPYSADAWDDEVEAYNDSYYSGGKWNTYSAKGSGYAWQEEADFYDKYEAMKHEEVVARHKELDDKPPHTLTANEKSEFYALDDLLNERRYNELSDKGALGLTDAEFQELQVLENALGYSA
jgi:predicted glutamine amidotransferase